MTLLWKNTVSKAQIQEVLITVNSLEGKLTAREAEGGYFMVFKAVEGCVKE